MTHIMHMHKNLFAGLFLCVWVNFILLASVFSFRILYLHKLRNVDTEMNASISINYPTAVQSEQITQFTANYEDIPTL